VLLPLLLPWVCVCGQAAVRETGLLRAATAVGADEAKPRAAAALHAYVVASWQQAQLTVHWHSSAMVQRQWVAG